MVETLQPESPHEPKNIAALLSCIYQDTTSGSPVFPHPEADVSQIAPTAALSSGIQYGLRWHYAPIACIHEGLSNTACRLAQERPPESNRAVRFFGHELEVDSCAVDPSRNQQEVQRAC